MKAAALPLVIVALVMATAVPRSPVEASNPGPSLLPLIGCPNVDGSGETPSPPDPATLGGVRVSDIIKVVEAYFHDAPAAFPNAIDSDYVLLYDRNADGRQRVDDILNVVEAYFTNCPKVDTQVAQATQWILVEHPEFLVEDFWTLANSGYWKSSADVPGQGVHYGNHSLRDDVFDPLQPEALVYNNGRLVAQLYYIEGYDVGWGPEPLPVPANDIDVDAFCTPPPGSDCSWSNAGGQEVDGWHVHFNLCTTNAGTIYENTFFLADSVLCEALHNSGKNYGWGGTWFWAARVGWMSHLWNHQPNLNGRFADCAPDPQGYQAYAGVPGSFKAHNCPQ